jgi:hypothetical protein
METIEDLAMRYREFSDEKILLLRMDGESYTPEAKSAMDLVILERGGFDKLQEAHLLSQKRGVEEQRLRNVIHRSYHFEKNRDKILAGIKSEIFNSEELRQIVVSQCDLEEEKIKDGKVSVRTILGTIAGGALGAIIGGFLLGLIAIKTGVFFYLTAVIPAGLGYGMAKRITRKSALNPFVMIAAFFSLVLGLSLAMFLFKNAESFGIERLHP